MRAIAASWEIKATVVAAVVAVVILTPRAEAQLVDDDAPWWLWPEVWTGEFEFDETVRVPGMVNEETLVKGHLLLDKKLVEGCTSSWVGSAENYAVIESQGAGKLDEQTEVARIHGRASSSARGRFPLADHSGLAISLEKGSYRVHLSARDGAVVEGSAGATGAVDTTGFSQSTGWEDHGKVLVEFDEKGYSPIPDTIGVLENGELAGAGASDAGFTSKFRWVLQPEHDIEKWVSTYIELLESERSSFIEKHEDFLEKMDCDGGMFDPIPCRAARAALDDVDRRIATLADDCRRVLEMLVNIECPGFSQGMRATPRNWQFESAVCTDPARTCDVIHRHLFDFFDAGATGDLLVTYRRLPNHLQCMYDYDDFNRVASLSSTDWLGQLLGQ